MIKPHDRSWLRSIPKSMIDHAMINHQLRSQASGPSQKKIQWSMIEVYDRSPKLVINHAMIDHARKIWNFKYFKKYDFYI